MKNTYRINSSDLRIDNVKAIFVPLDRTFKIWELSSTWSEHWQRDIMALIHKRKPIRATQYWSGRTVTGAIRINILKTYLIEKENFSKEFINGSWSINRWRFKFNWFNFSGYLHSKTHCILILLMKELRYRKISISLLKNMQIWI